MATATTGFLKVVHVVKADKERGFGITLGRLKNNTGMFIEKVTSDSPAQHAGICVTDRIIRVNNVSVDNPRKTKSQIRDRVNDSGNHVVLELVDSATNENLKLTGKSLYQLEMIYLSNQPRITRYMPRLCHLVKTTPSVRYGFSLGTTKENILYILNVEPGTPAQGAGLRNGDVIMEVNRRNIAQLNQQQIVSSTQGSLEMNLIVVHSPEKLERKKRKLVSKSRELASNGAYLYVRTPAGFDQWLANVPHAHVYLKLQKQQADGYGFYLNKDKCDAKHVISQLDDGSVAHAAGLKVGHRVIEVNTINVEYDTHQEVVERIKTRPCQVSLLVVNQQTYDYFHKKNVPILGRPEDVTAETSVLLGSILDQWVGVIVNVTTKDLNLANGVLSASILKAAGPTLQTECKKLAPEGIGPGQVVTSSSGKIVTCSAIIHGMCDHYVDTAPCKKMFSDFIQACLKAAHGRGFRSIAFPAIGTGNLRFPADVSATLMKVEIEKFIQENQTSLLKEILIVIWPSQTADYETFKRTFTIRSGITLRGKRSRDIALGRTTILFENLKEDLSCGKLFWDDSGNKRVVVDPASEEYKSIAAAFAGGLTHAVIIKQIERIQNEELLQQFSMAKSLMEKRLVDANVTRKLWHGTSSDPTVIDNIIRGGFNRGYCGKNAVAHGKGVYFAKNSSYSANDTYSNPDAAGNKYMFYVHVLVGNYTIGNSTMVEPPMQPGTDIKFDSVVNNVTNPEIFVVFRDNLAYPDYLITFSNV